uniref:Uncharacterized protein n=1 Tax=Glossina palpalis gambiensis TaxID=67801 RepID=A0A1B0AT03_9MUSC
MSAIVFIHTSICKCVNLYDDFLWLNIAVAHVNKGNLKVNGNCYRCILRKILRLILEIVDIEKGCFQRDGIKCRIADVALDYLWGKFDDAHDYHLKTWICE